MRRKIAAKKYDGNLNDWADAIDEKRARQFVQPDVYHALKEARDVGVEGLRVLDLPRYKKKRVSFPRFMQNTQLHLKTLGSGRFYVTLLPSNLALPRYSHSGMDESELIQYVNANVSFRNQKHYSIIIQQFFENLYGGNIVIGNDGSFYAEFAEGKQGPVAKGTKTPEFFVRRDPFTLSFRYSFENQKLRDAIYKMFCSIPHEGEGRDIKFTPGYYEFALVCKDGQSNIEPIFIDYRNSPAYFLPAETNR